MTPLATLLASSPIPSPDLWQLADSWVIDNPACLSVRHGKWASLLRVAATAPSYSQLLSRVSEHLNRAGTFGDSKRWRNTDLTAALERILAEASSIDPIVAGRVAPIALALRETLGAPEQEWVRDAWKRHLALTFLRALHDAVRKKRDARNQGG